MSAVEAVPAGVNYELYQITTPRRIPVMPSNVAELVKVGTSAKIDLTESTLSDYMAMRFEGFITTPSDGSYTFALYSDE